MTRSLPDAGKSGRTSSLGTCAQLPSPWVSIATEFMIGPREGKPRLRTKNPKTSAHFTNCQRPQTQAPALISVSGRWILLAVLRRPPRHQRDEPAEVALADSWVYDEEGEDPADEEGVAVVERDAEPVQARLRRVDVLGDRPFELGPSGEERDDEGEDGDEHPDRPGAEGDARARLLLSCPCAAILQTEEKPQRRPLYAFCACSRYAA